MPENIENTFIVVIINVYELYNEMGEYEKVSQMKSLFFKGLILGLEFGPDDQAHIE